MKAKLLAVLAAVCMLVAIGCDDEDTVVGSQEATLNIVDTLVQADEGQTLQFTVGLSTGVNRVVTFEYSVTGISADSGTDFVVTDSRDSLLPFVTQKQIEVQITEDQELEADEELSLSLTSVSNAEMGSTTTAVGKIVDNDLISFSEDIKPNLLFHSCGTSVCHGTLIQSGGIFIGDSAYYASRPDGLMYDTLLAQTGNNGTLVVPNFPDSSTLYLSLTATPPYGGNQMESAQTQDPLTADEINRIRLWIEQGAQDN